MNGVKSPPRRIKCAATTREKLLTAARSRFLHESYENVGLRDIAADAGVDVALVSRYFGSKEELFRLVLRGCSEQPLRLEVAAEGLAAHLASLLGSENIADPAEKTERLLIMLRSASSPIASSVIREAVRTDVLDPLAAAIGGENSQMKAAMILGLLMGTTMLKTILQVDAGDDLADARQRMQKLFETALAD